MRMDFSSPKYSGEPLETHQARLETYEHLCAFMFAGNATLTLRSIKTQQRFTYRIKAAKEQEGKPNTVSHFIAVLTGSHNESDYTYLGHIFRDSQEYSHGRKSHIGIEAPSSAAWEWFYHCVVETKHMFPDKLEIWHEGRCGKCNRKLTVPESIASGIGPECAKHMGSSYLHAVA